MRYIYSRKNARGMIVKCRQIKRVRKTERERARAREFREIGTV